MKMFDRLCDQVLAVVMPKVVEMLKGAHTHGLTGMIVAGTWDPAHGTASILLTDTAFVFTDQGDQPIVIPNVPIVTTHPTHQVGPIGDEWGMLHRTQVGWIFKFHADQTGKGIGAPAGETWTVHQTPTGTDPLTGKIQTKTDLTSKITNDGTNEGDGKVGHQVQGGDYHVDSTAAGHTDSKSDTNQQMVRKSAGGHNETLDDKLKKITHTTAGGFQHALDDLNGFIKHSDPTGQMFHLIDSGKTSGVKAMSHVVPPGVALALGDTAAKIATSAGNAALAKVHGDKLGGNVDTAILQQAISMVNLLNAVGTMTTAQRNAALLSLVAGFFTSVVKIDGAPSVFIKTVT